MNKKKVKNAISLARELIRRGNIVLNDEANVLYIHGNSNSAALRRTSMELTKALAELRKPM